MPAVHHMFMRLSISHCIKFTLSRDVEKNPGPSTVIDPNKTVCAPYSHGNISLFGSNAGRQCVAMSQCGLLYNYRNPITSSADLLNIMNIGNYILFFQDYKPRIFTFNRIT